jgi:hypothetical protein
MFKLQTIFRFLTGQMFILKLDDGGGGGNTGSQTSVSELPEWAKPYAKSTLEKGAALTETPYQTYNAPRIAGFSPMQQQAQQGAANMQTNFGTGAGMDIAGMAALGGLGQNYQGGNFYGGRFSPRSAAQYMSPFIENAMQPQLREAQRASDIMGQQQNAQAVGRGAFGGSRDALMRAERERNLGMQQGDIRAKGYQTAYEQAANQFNQDMSRGLTAQQLGEQSRQFGANLGLQGLNTALQGAGQLGTLGSQQFQQGMDINKLQSTYGAQQQALQQQGLDTAYQDFLNQQNYPYKQLGFMSDMIRGLPLGQQSTQSMYQSPGSLAGQLGGLGMGAYGLSQMMRKEGGMVDSYADGGSVDSANNIASILSRLSDEQLMQAKQAAMSRRDMEEIGLIDEEMSHRASLRRGVGAAPVNAEAMASDQNPESISSFAKGGSAVESLLAQPQEKDTPVDEAALSLLEKLGARSKPAMDALNAQIETQKGRGEEIRGRGFNEALAQYGFKMAQAASKPGARFMNAAAEASPVLAESAINTNKAVNAAQDNYTRLKMDQQKYQIALDKGDMQTAATLAGQIRQEKQAAKTYGLQAAHMIDQFNNQKAQIAATSAAASRDAPFLQVVNDLAKDPRNQGKSREELMNMASKAMYGAQYGRVDATMAIGLEKAFEKDRELNNLGILLLGAKTDEQKQKIKDDMTARRDQIKAEMMSTMGGNPSGSISSALPQKGSSMADKGFKLIGTE